MTSRFACWVAVAATGLSALACSGGDETEFSAPELTGNASVSEISMTSEGGSSRPHSLRACSSRDRSIDTASRASKPFAPRIACFASSVVSW